MIMGTSSERTGSASGGQGCEQQPSIRMLTPLLICSRLALHKGGAFQVYQKLGTILLTNKTVFPSFFKVFFTTVAQAWFVDMR